MHLLSTYRCGLTYEVDPDLELKGASFVVVTMLEPRNNHHVSAKSPRHSHFEKTLAAEDPVKTT